MSGFPSGGELRHITLRITPTAPVFLKVLTGSADQCREAAVMKDNHCVLEARGIASLGVGVITPPGKS